MEEARSSLASMQAQYEEASQRLKAAQRQAEEAEKARDNLQRDVKDLEEQSDAIYDIAVTMKGENSDGEEITILDNLEILAAEADGSFGVLG